MEKTKEQMIADLYALRGGLSVISGHTDEIREQEGLIKANLNKAIDISKQGEKSQSKQEILLRERKQYLDNIDASRKEIAKINTAAQARIEDLERGLKSKRRIRSAAEVTYWGLIISCIMFIVAVCWMIGDIRPVVTAPPELKEGYKEGLKKMDSIPLCIGICVVAIILFLIEFIVNKVNIAKKKRDFINGIAKIKDETKHRIANEKMGIQHNQKIIFELDQKIEKEQKQQTALSEEFDRQSQRNVVEKEQQTQKIQAITEQSKLVKAALNETYDSWLSESDWRNVDLLIYYLETSRADDLKEALQLVDKQRQTETIAKAIATAARAIQDTVHTATMRLAGAMEASFSLLSDKLSAINAKMGRFNALIEQNNELQEKYAQNVSAMSSQLAKVQGEQLAIQRELLNTEKLNGALLEKANRSSEDLLNDLRYGQRYWVK